MNRFRHELEGIVKVRLQGCSPERFFNLCGQGEIEIWNISCTGHEYECCMTVKGFFACRSLAQKSGIRLKLLKKQGLPFFFYRNRKRKLWAAGFFSFFLILYLCSLFIWDIEFQGNLRHSDQELLNFLEMEEIACGKRKTKIDCEELEGRIRSQYSDVTWVSARVEGTRLYIHIKENDVVLTVPEKDSTPADLVAAEDGEIVSVIVRSGTPMVHPGDIVKKGQVLVSGTISITDDSGTVISEHTVRADADIVGRRRRVDKKKISMWHEERLPTGRKRRGLFFQIFGKTFILLPPDFKGAEWIYTSETRQAHITETFCLPFFYGTIGAEEYALCTMNYTEKELSRMAEEYRRETEAKLIEKGVQIIENNVTILNNGSACQFQLEMTVEEPFCLLVPVEEKGDPKEEKKDGAAEAEESCPALEGRQ
ncbi:MAG: sporulation protein YqfD [Clostridium sp.]|nr:sporulation protein YqfD [Clostridium sp.]